MHHLTKMWNYFISFERSSLGNRLKISYGYAFCKDPILKNELKVMWMGVTGMCSVSKLCVQYMCIGYLMLL